MKFTSRKLPRHYRFEYTPRYYDPEKERIQQMTVDYNKTDDVGSALKSQISKGFRKGGQASRIQFQTQRSVQSTASNKRLFYIIIALATITYLALESNVEGILAALTAQ